MKKTVFPALLGAVVVVLSVAGCGGPTKDATYENATKLREAVIASGVDCPGDAPDPSKDGSEDFIKCSTDMGLHVFTTDSEMSLGKTLMSFTKTTSLQGPHWIVEAHDASVLAKIKDKLGGSLVVP